MYDKLKPCPFCGSEVILVSRWFPNWGDGITKYRVECKRRDEDCPVDVTTRYKFNKPDTIKAWNQRVR
jgi:Lar family restriction alleviation protein